MIDIRLFIISHTRKYGISLRKRRITLGRPRLFRIFTAFDSRKDYSNDTHASNQGASIRRYSSHGYLSSRNLLSVSCEGNQKGRIGFLKYQYLLSRHRTDQARTFTSAFVHSEELSTMKSREAYKRIERARIDAEGELSAMSDEHLGSILSALNDLLGTDRFVYREDRNGITMSLWYDLVFQELDRRGLT